jgi:FMN-dependent NADH-azoreductase
MTTNILRIDTAITGDASVSLKLTDRVMARLAAAHPDADVTTRDLSAGVPHIDAAWLGAVYTPADKRSTEQADVADYSDTLLAEVRAADILVIGMPVYNFGVPAPLKGWIDHLARKGETFVYTDKGPKGLLENKRAIVVMTSGGTKFGSDIDFASGYVRHMLGFFGITDVEFVTADAIALAPEETVKSAEAQADALAA